MLSSAPGSPLRKLGLESLFERERKACEREKKNIVVFRCVCVCVCTYACVTCASVCVQAKVSILVFSLLLVCVCMSEIKFVWGIGKEELRDERVKEAKDGQI